MKLNVWKNQEIPNRLFRVDTKGNNLQKILRSKSEIIYGYVLSKGVAFLIGNEEKIKQQFEVTEADITDLSNEHQLKLFYHIIDYSLFKKGFTLLKRQRIFFLPKKTSSNLLRSNDDKTIFVNIGFKYSLTTLNNRILLLINPLQVVTTNGDYYNNIHANSSNSTILEDKNLRPKYEYNCRILSEIISIISQSKGLSFDFGSNGKLVFSESNDINVTIFREPELDFGKGKYHTWAKSGLANFHPLDYNEGQTTRPDQIKIALIGTTKSYAFLDKLGNGESNKKYPFKGFNKIYKTTLKMGKERFIELNDNEIDNIEDNKEIVNLMLSKIISLKNKQIDFDVCLLEMVPQWSSFFINQPQNLHDLLKVEAWKNRIKTQLYTERTNTDIQTETLNNIALGIYYKSGGNPWRINTNFQDIAYIGISFGYSEIDKKRLVGIAEIFDNFGQFVSLRSITIKEVSIEDRIEERRNVHLSRKQLSTLVKNLLDDYGKTLEGSLPENLIIHKTTYFNKFEKAALQDLSSFPISFSLVHLQKENNWHIITKNRKEPIRGSFLRLNNNKAILYTSGLLSGQNKYFLPGSPKPYLVNLDSQSNFTIKQICIQILELTKLNFNSTNTYSKEPVTLLHSRGIVNLLRAGLMPIDIPTDPRYFL